MQPQSPGQRFLQVEQHFQHSESLTEDLLSSFEGARVAVGQDKCAVSNHELKAFAIKPSAFHSLITTCLVHWLRRAMKI